MQYDVMIFYSLRSYITKFTIDVFQVFSILLSHDLHIYIQLVEFPPDINLPTMYIFLILPCYRPISRRQTNKIMRDWCFFTLDTTCYR